MNIKEINEKIKYYNELKKLTENAGKIKFYNNKLKSLREAKKELTSVN